MLSVSGERAVACGRTRTGERTGGATLSLTLFVCRGSGGVRRYPNSAAVSPWEGTHRVSVPPPPGVEVSRATEAGNSVNLNERYTFVARSNPWEASGSVSKEILRRLRVSWGHPASYQMEKSLDYIRCISDRASLVVAEINKDCAICNKFGNAPSPPPRPPIQQGTAARNALTI